MAQESLLVHSKETPVDYPSSTSYKGLALKSVHQEWKAARAGYSLLEDLGELHKLDAFDFCRKVSWFVRHEDTGRVRVASLQCHLRWCPLCAKVRTNYVSHQVQEWIQHTKYAKFITLTVKSNDDPIESQINHLYDSFKRLRKKKEWKKKISGGVWFFQITFNKESQQWHPHIHIIAIGKFYSKRLLSSHWLLVTGDSPIVDIKAVKDAKKAAQYAARYAAKPANLSNLEPSTSAELIMAMQSRRICGCWGKGCKIIFRPRKPDDADSWKNIGDFSHVVELIGCDSSADYIWLAWQNDSALDVCHNLSYLDARIDGREVNDAPEQPPPVKQYQFEFFKES